MKIRSSTAKLGPSVDRKLICDDAELIRSVPSNKIFIENID